MSSTSTSTDNVVDGQGQTTSPLNHNYPTMLSKEQEQALFAAFEELPNGSDLRDIVTIMLRTGIRRGELEQLRWSDIDHKTGELHVGSRRIPLLNDIVAVFTDRATRVCAEHVIGPHPKAAMAKASRGLQLAANSIGLPRLRFHDFRYTFASRCMAHGMSVAVLCLICGWSFSSLRKIVHQIVEAPGFEVEDWDNSLKDLKETN
jgi:integrase